MARLHQARLSLGNRTLPQYVLTPRRPEARRPECRRPNPGESRTPNPERSSARPRFRTAARGLLLFQVNFAPNGWARDLMGWTAGRVGSTGCVTSGRRWHRRIPPFVSRFGVAHRIKNSEFGSKNAMPGAEPSRIPNSEFRILNSSPVYLKRRRGRVG